MENKNYITGNRKYMNPYLAGVLLGVVLLLSFYLTGRGLGASGAMKSVVVTSVEKVSPAHAEDSGFYSKYLGGEDSPMKTWLVFEVLGVLVGGFLSGAFSGRLKFKLERSPKITNRKRILLATIGGALFGFGSQLGRGCTSGAALSGMSVLSVAGFVTMMAIFGTAFALAYFFRKNWI
ncbi:YeeE/YedE thiosulfate transporter family protein [Flammeovirgaceae bacterium SG7u.111]|nr:YeeE/YedE thiosulfate transporter family protein [Flammeovirgaceae bacterium SG7u.132]WPO36920.1 YeeE/YedE thiosulfate transporter family protein [Flammeovirgaceae bacterium SG7u.111]